MASAVIGALRVNLSLDSAAFANGLKGAQTGLQRFGKIAAVGVAAAAAAFTTAAGALAVAMKGTINEAEKLGALAQQIGIPVDELSRLKHAAELSEVSLEGLSTGVRKLSKSMADVAQGAGKNVKGAFDALQVSVQNSDGSLRSSSEVLADLADRFSRMEDGATKTALAIAIFGRSGAQLIPLLNAGRDGMQAMKDEADRLGIVIDTKTAAAADRFNDNLTRLLRVKDGIVTKITAEMLPAFVNLSQALIDTANNTDVMRQVSGFLVKSFRVAIDIAAQVAVGIRRISIELAGLGEMSRLFLQGEFSAGWQAYQDAVLESQKAFAGLAAFQLKMLDSGAFDAPEITPPDYSPTITDLDGVAAAARAANSELEQMNSRAQSLFEATRKPIEAYGLAVTELNELFADGAIGFDTYNRALAESRTELSTFADVSKDVGQSLQSSIGGAFESIMQGTFNLRDALAGLMQDLARLALNTFLQSLLKGVGFGGGVGGGFALPKFAQGGSFKVGGSGGVDSQVVAFRATPGERVTVDHGGGGMAPVININVAGARGNQEIRAMVAEGVGQGLSAYDRSKQRQQLTAG